MRDTRLGVMRCTAPCISFAPVVMGQAMASDGLRAGALSMRELGDALDAFEVAHNWLTIQPAATCAEFAAILAEMLKAPAVVNRAAEAMLAAFDAAEPRPAALHPLANWSLVLEVERDRPHAAVLAAIAARHIHPHLDALPDDADAMLLRQMLHRLSDPGRDSLPGLTRFAEAVCDLAEETQRLSRRGQMAQAVAILRAAAPSLLDARRRAQGLDAVLARRQAGLRLRALGLATA